MSSGRSSESMRKVGLQEEDEEESLSEEGPIEVPSPPDGGYGWVVVFASFICFVIVDGIIFSFGIFLREFAHTFNESKSSTAWVASIQTGCYLLAGPVAAGLANAFGCRAVTIGGSILAATGFIAAVFAKNIVHLYITLGLLGGTGFGLIFLPAAVTISFYFERKRAFATGMAVCGSGIGGFLMAPCCQKLVEVFGWRGSLLILAGLTLNCCVVGALFRPIEEPEQKPETPPMKPLLIRIKEARDAMTKWDSEESGIDETLLSQQRKRKRSCPPPRILHDVMSTEEKSSSSSTTGSNNSPPPPYFETVGSHQQYSCCHNNNQLSTNYRPQRRFSCTKYRPRRMTAPEMRPFYRQDILFSASLIRIPEYRSQRNSYHQSIANIPKPAEGKKLGCLSSEMTDTFKQMLDISLLTSPTFVLLALSGFLTLAGFFIPFMYIVDKAVLSGISPESAAFILSVIGITNTVGRVFSGWVSDRPSVNALCINNVALTIGGIATGLCPFFDTYVLLLVYSAVFGFSIACFAALRSIIAVEMFGVEKLTNAFGLLLLFQGVASIIGSPVAGLFFDMTGTYNASFYIAGFVITLSGVMCFPLPWVSNWERKRKEGPLPEIITTNDDEKSLQRSSAVSVTVT
ncbi:monocarboxylate transporter 12-like [Ornithodoros turicata]